VRWRQLSTVGLALLAVLALGYLQPSEYAEPMETLWAALGACGSVYAAQAWWRRLEMDRWRRRERYNGLFAMACQQHLVLRMLGLIVELLILAGGLAAMLTPPSIRPELRANEVFTTATLIGIGVVSTFAVYFAERQAIAMARYVVVHPEL